MLSAWVPGPKTYKGEVYRLVDPFRYVASYFSFVQALFVPRAKYMYSSFKPGGKRTLTDFIYCCKMTPVMVLGGVTSFSLLKDVANRCKRMRHSATIGGNLISTMAESWKKLKTSNVFLSFTDMLSF